MQRTESSIIWMFFPGPSQYLSAQYKLSRCRSEHDVSVCDRNEQRFVWHVIFQIVIKTTSAEEFSYYNSFDAYTYAVYDPNNIAGRKIKLQAEVVTFFSSHPFTVKADKGGMVSFEMFAFA